MRKETNKKKYFKLLMSIIIILSLLISFLIIQHIYTNYGINIYKKFDSADYAKSLQNSEVIEKLNKLEAINLGVDVSEVPFQKNFFDYKNIEEKSFDYRMPHPYAGFKSQPSVKVKMEGKGDQEWDIEINDFGHRSPNLGKKKQNTIRIAILGGSVAFNGPTNERTIIGYVSNFLIEKGFEVEYVNAAIVSGISNQELSVLVHELIDLDIDLLITLDGYNDINQISLYNARVGWPSFKWNDVYYPFLKPTLDILSSELIDSSLDNYLKNILKIAAISEKFEISYIALLQPMKNFNTHDCNDKKLSMNHLFYCKASDNYMQFEKIKVHGANYISLADFFNKNPELFTDEVHITEEGNVIIAKHIINLLTIENK
jgi:hypothetical protein